MVNAPSEFLLSCFSHLVTLAHGVVMATIRESLLSTVKPFLKKTSVSLNPTRLKMNNNIIATNENHLDISDIYLSCGFNSSRILRTNEE